MQIIREISALETFPVRHPVLRPGKNIETCHFEGDSLPSTHHFGLFTDDELAGVASLFKADYELFVEKTQFQLRGMAVLEKFQKRGIGVALVNYAESKAKSLNAEIIWFNAREIAVPFYQKLGYEVTGKPFNIGDIGAHFIMFKSV